MYSLIPAGGMNEPIIVNGAPTLLLQANTLFASPLNPQSSQERLMPSARTWAGNSRERRARRTIARVMDVASISPSGPDSSNDRDSRSTRHGELLGRQPLVRHREAPRHLRTVLGQAH